MEVKVYRSRDGRERTNAYLRDGKEFFALGEQTKYGALITEFKKNGEIVNQFRVKDRSIDEVLLKYLGAEKLDVEEVERYERVAVAAKCSSCGNKLIRELDEARPEEITEVPVVPIWRCESCKERFYSIGKEYLNVLADSHKDLFDNKDLEELEVNKEAFISLLQEYVIRIFASKKLKRIDIGE